MGESSDDRPRRDPGMKGTSGFTINGISFDPAGPPDQATWDDLDSRYVLVQTDTPLDTAGWKELADAGFDVHEHIGGNTYLGAYRGRELDALRGISSVAWVGSYPIEAKIAPSLGDSEEARSPAYRRSPLSTAADREVDVVLHADVDPTSSDVRSRVARAAGVDDDRIQVGRRKYRLIVNVGTLEEISAIDEVRHIEEVFASGVGNNVATQIINAGVVVNGTPYEGDGEVIAIADTGFDKGSTSNVHAAFTNRVANLYDLGRPGMFNDPDGHGTHVAGSALGDGNSASMGGSIRGTAPQARLVVQSMLDSTGGLGGIPVDLHDLFRPPYDNDGARIHSNSWGMYAPALAYNQRSTEIDDFAWTHQDLVILSWPGTAARTATVTASSRAGRSEPRLPRRTPSRSAPANRTGDRRLGRWVATWTRIDPRSSSLLTPSRPIRPVTTPRA